MCGGKNKSDSNDNQPKQNRGSPPPSIFLGQVDPSEESFVRDQPSKIMHVKKMSELRSFYNNAGDKLVMVDFYATWCQPCQRMAPILEQWVDTYQKDVTFVKVNVDSCEQDLITEYNISSVPTFVFTRKGQVVAQFTGGKYQELKAILEKNRSGLETEPPKKSMTTASLLREGIRALKLQEGRHSRKNTNEGDKNERRESKRASREEKKMSRKSEDRKQGEDDKKRKSIISLRRHSSKHSTKSKRLSTEKNEKQGSFDSDKPKKSDASGTARTSNDSSGHQEEDNTKTQKNSLDSNKEKTSLDSNKEKTSIDSDKQQRTSNDSGKQGRNSADSNKGTEQ